MKLYSQHFLSLIAQQSNRAAEQQSNWQSKNKLLLLLLLIFSSMANAQSCHPIISQTGFIDPCLPGSSVTLTANGVGMATYLWSTGLTSPFINVTSTGTYTVTVTFTGGCTGTASITIVPTTSYHIIMDGPTSACNTGNHTFTITNLINPLTVYTWTNLSPGYINSITPGPLGQTAVLNLNGPNGSTHTFTVSYVYGTCTISETFYLYECCASPHPLLFVDVNTSSLNAATFLNNTSIIDLHGTIIVDNNFVISNCPNVRMGVGSQFIVQPGFRLQVDNSHLQGGCDLMWKGILSEVGGYIRFAETSIIEDAEIAMDVRGGSGTMFELDATSNYPPNIVRNCVYGVRITNDFTNIGIGLTNFDFTGFLHPPYPGQQFIGTDRPRAAFLLQDVFIPQNYGFLNHPIVIDGWACGYELHNSSAFIKYNQFYHIQPGLNYGNFLTTSNGFAVWAEANNNRRVSVDGWGASVTSPVTFEDCRGGVFSQAMSTTVTNCRMENMLLGIHSQLAQLPSTLTFQNNNIEAEVPALSYTCNDRNRGITLLNDATSQINVNTNEIRLNRNCTSLLANEGIVFLDIPLANNSTANIYDNNIILQNWARWAINCDGIRGGTVDLNQLNLSNITGPAALGLRSNNCERLTVSNNVAFSATFQASASGFRTLNSMNWNYDCNTTDLVHTSFFFQGFCQSISSFTANTMGRSNYGLAISGAGSVIGKQILQGNFWNGTVLSANPWDYFPGNGMAAILSGAGVAGNEFEVHTPQSLPPTHHPISTYTTLSFTQTGITAASCILQPIPFAPPIDSTQIFVEAINGSTTQNNSDNTMADWSKTGYIYETADIDSALRYSNPIIENYYDSLTSEGIGWLRAIKRNWEVLNPENELMANQYQANINNIDSLCALNRTLIENIATNNSFYSDSIKSNLQLMAYNNQLMELINTNNAIALAIENNESQKCDAAIFDCANAVTNSIYEQNKIAVMQIYFATVGRHYYIFSEEQAGTLLSIGSQCASYGGPAVFEARNLYLLINPTYDFDLYLCSNGNGKFAFENDGEQTSAIENKIEVTPNPATGNTIYINATNHIANVNFVNTLGQIIFTTQIINGAVDISTLPNGIFMVQCKYDNEEISSVTAKIVITR